MIGGEAAPWWHVNHTYLNDVEMLGLGGAIDDDCSEPKNFPDSISAAAGAVMGEQTRPL